MLFLGTGAAELYPNPFCDCETCQRARREGAIPRKRSALLVDNETLLDFGPEVPAASQMYNAPLCGLRQVFITHTHEDHFSMGTLDILTMTPRRFNDPICFYMSPEALAWVQEITEESGATSYRGVLSKNVARFCALEPYKPHQIGGMEVYAVQSNHHGCGEGELALNYRLTLADGRRLLYVTDSGLYSEDNLQALKDSLCDILVMEGTNGSRTVPRDAGHLNAEHFCENVANMAVYGVIKRDAGVYVTHINQVNHFSHAEYQAYLNENCVIPAVVAYDGMTI